MATNFFLKFETPSIKGECTDSQHKDELQLLSWSHSFNQPTKPTRSTSGGGTVEQANHSDFSFTKYLDSATDDLLQKCWSGKQIGKGTFTAYRADGQTDTGVKYLEVIMEEIVVYNVSFGGGGGDLPTETVALAYGKVTYNYIPQKPSDGSAGGVQPVTHDLVAQKVNP